MFGPDRFFFGSVVVRLTYRTLIAWFRQTDSSVHFGLATQTVVFQNLAPTDLEFSPDATP
jgi:hypothetical protein